MNKKQLMVAWIVVLTFITSGCFPVTNAKKSTHITETTLEWYAYWRENDSERNRLKAEYRNKIDRYLEAHPETSKEIADKMRNCRVTVGMAEEQILTMVKPHYTLKGKHKNEKIFKYSNVGRFEWSKFIGEGVRVWITLTNSVVTDISEVDLVIGY